MGLGGTDGSELRFAGYVEGLASVIGHADRVGPLRDYCVGLMLPCERKNVEPMAAVTAPERAAAQHQSLLHFVGNAAWSDERVLAKVREMVLPQVERHGPIEAWIIDDTGFPKQGRHSVGVARQYCGQLGKQDNCQVAVSLSVANHHASLPVAYRLYLPQDWAKDRSRRRKAGVPKEISFKTKPEIALEQLHWACEAGLPRGVVLMDAGYGTDTAVRANITTLGLSYVAGIRPNTTVWAPGTGPLPPKKWSGQGRPPKLIRRDPRHGPNSVKALALALPPAPIQELRDLTRTRKQLGREIVQHTQRIQKVLEDANIKLSSLITEVLGASGRLILKALIAGESDAGALAALGGPRLKCSRQELRDALEGRITSHHRFLVGQHLRMIEELEAMVTAFDARIETVLAPFRDAAERLMSLPGISDVAAQVILAEIGTDMSSFPAGKRRSTRL